MPDEKKIVCYIYNEGHGATHQFSSIGLPRCNLVLAGHGEVDGIDHDAVTASILCCRWGDNASR